MLQKKTIWFLFWMAPAAGFVPSQSQQAPRSSEIWVITKGSSLRVDGSTNVNHFSCEIADYCNPDTLLADNGAGATQDGALTLTGMIGVNVIDFDCHNAMMTAEMRKTLRAAAFPRLFIHFLSLSRLPVAGSQPAHLTGQVDIELAGITRRLEISYTSSSSDQRAILLRGDQQIKFSDFKLVPPRKLGGMIRTRDQLDIEFCLNLKVLKD